MFELRSEKAHKSIDCSIKPINACLVWIPLLSSISASTRIGQTVLVIYPPPPPLLHSKKSQKMNLFIEMNSEGTKLIFCILVPWVGYVKSSHTVEKTESNQVTGPNHHPICVF